MDLALISDTRTAVGHYFGNTALPLKVLAESGDTIDPTIAEERKQAFLNGLGRVYQDTIHGKLRVSWGIGRLTLLNIMGAAGTRDWTKPNGLRAFYDDYATFLDSAESRIRSGLLKPAGDYITAESTARAQLFSPRKKTQEEIQDEWIRELGLDMIFDKEGDCWVWNMARCAKRLGLDL